MSIHDDLSPSALPFTTYMRDAVLNDAVSVEPSYVAYECINIAKRILLELKVREFSAGDVVALASMIEARDRANRK